MKSTHQPIVVAEAFTLMTLADLRGQQENAVESWEIAEIREVPINGDGFQTLDSMNPQHDFAIPVMGLTFSRPGGMSFE